MRSFKGYVLLVHPIPILGVCAVALLLGVSIATTRAEYERLALALLAILLSQILVGASNDVIDLPQDRLSQPWKPLVAGFLPMRHVYVFIAADVILLAALLFWLGLPVSVGVAVGTFAGLAHNLWTKGTRSDVLTYALGFLSLPITIWLALHRWKPEQALLFVPAAFLMVAVLLARDVPDIHADGAVGKKSLAVRLGAKQTTHVICACLLLAGIAAFLTMQLAPVNFMLLSGGLVIYFLLAAVTVYRYLGKTDEGLLRTNFRLALVGAVFLIGVCLFALKA